MPDPTELAAQDAADALIAMGWTIEPYGPDMDQWLVGALVLDDSELLALAARQGVQVTDGRVQ